jgi:hypothetical protein
MTDKFIEPSGGSSLAKALAKAQCEISNPSFDAANPHFKNKFASLAAVRNATIPFLAKHGIAVVQNLTVTEAGLSCETILFHESGETLTFGPLVLPPTKADAQGFGSAATYARRYSLMAVAGVVGEEDDDGEGAVTSAAERAKYTKSVNEYSKRVLESMNAGKEGHAVDIMREAKEAGEDFIADVWRTLSTPVQQRLRDLQKT